MELNHALVFVGTLWAIYVTFVGWNFGKSFKIYRNLLCSWTGSRRTANIIRLSGEPYARFSIEDYKDVPRAFWLLRLHYNTFRFVLIAAVILFLLFFGLGIFTASIAWQTIGCPGTLIPEGKAKILIAGHILVFFFTLGIWPFFRYIESQYLEHYYIINAKAERVKTKMETKDS